MKEPEQSVNNQSKLILALQNLGHAVVILRSTAEKCNEARAKAFDHSHSDISNFLFLVKVNMRNFIYLNCTLFQPGDCIVFHMRTVHSSHGNNLSTPRRAFSTRWLGDDTVKGERPWMNLPPSHELAKLQRGDKLLESCLFPVVWTGVES